MKRYKVCLTQDVTQSMVLNVEAASEGEAMDKAVALYKSGEFMEQGVKFEVDDNAYEEPYVSWAERE